MSGRLYSTIDDFVRNTLPLSVDTPIYRITSFASKLGFKDDDLREVEATYYRQLKTYDETCPTPRSMIQAMHQEEERTSRAYEATMAYMRKRIDEWQK